MKKFISTLPLQPNAAGNLALEYSYDKSCGFEYLNAVRNPIIPFILRYADQGENIGVYLIVEEKSVSTEAGQIHLKNFTEELERIKQEKGFICEPPQQIVIQSPQDITEYMRLVQKLIHLVEDGDEIYADITYGRKAVPIAQLIALKYASRIRKNVEIGTLSYGEAHNPGKDGEAQPTVFDLEGFFAMDEMIANIASNKNADKDIDGYMKNMISYWESR